MTDCSTTFKSAPYQRSKPSRTSIG